MNAIDSAGVSRQVIHHVKEWREWLENDNDLRQRFAFWTYVNDSRRDAEYIVQCLRALLPLESKRFDGSPRPHRKTTAMCLWGNSSNETTMIAVFCDFLRQTDIDNNNLEMVQELLLYPLSGEQYRLLLESLHTNKSIKELSICFRWSWNDNAAFLLISNLLQHKTNLTSLRICECRFPIADIHSLLRRGGLTQLQKLSFHGCAIDDEGTRLILDAIIRDDGDSFPVLDSLDLSNNRITSVGLLSLTELGPTGAPFVRLKKLDLGSNFSLLEDLERTRLFVRNILLSDEMSSLLELHIPNCNGNVHAIRLIIQACESNKSKLQTLNVKTNRDNHLQPIRDQLIESIPRMNTLRHLICSRELFNVDNGKEPAMMITKALQQNTTIVKITSDDCIKVPPAIAAPILHRNLHLAHADSLLALQPKTQMPISSKNGIWCMAFEKMGAARNRDDSAVNGGGGYPGASAIFKILLQKHPTSCHL